jgi:hypothetical protein
MNLQELLLSYFNDLEPDVQEVVSEVYSLERNYSDFYDHPKGILIKIKNIIDRVSDFNLEKRGL